MPGIITHKTAFYESLAYLHGKKHRSFLSRSIEALFGSADHHRAALFGTLGPNIFDYWPLRRHTAIGSSLSGMLHDGGAVKLSIRMLDRIIAMTDFNNEWSSTQRAYFYGFVSHLVCDYIIHPFVFYWSGFPSQGGKAETRFYREQNLLFQYNMDLFFQYHYREKRRSFEVDDMLPVRGKGLSSRLDPPVKEFILGSLEEEFPGKIDRLVWKKGPDEDRRLSHSLGFLDVCPALIKAAYRIKMGNHPRYLKTIKALRRRNLVYSDFLVPYPHPRSINRHIINLHRERWLNPAGTSGIRYESVEDLMRQCCEITVEVWERTEGILFGQKRNYERIQKHLSVNALTGQPGMSFSEMKHKEPVILKY